MSTIGNSATAPASPDMLMAYQEHGRHQVLGFMALGERLLSSDITLCFEEELDAAQEVITGIAADQSSDAFQRANAITTFIRESRERRASIITGYTPHAELREAAEFDDDAQEYEDLIAKGSDPAIVGSTGRANYQRSITDDVSAAIAFMPQKGGPSLNDPATPLIKKTLEFIKIPAIVSAAAAAMLVSATFKKQA